MVDLDLNVFPNFYLLSPNSRLFKLFPISQLPTPNFRLFPNSQLLSPGCLELLTPDLAPPWEPQRKDRDWLKIYVSIL